MRPKPYLDGKMLIAMPGMADQRFARSVIYLCAHSENGAMGIIVNKPSLELSILDLLDRLGVVPQEELKTIPAALADTLVHFGGPVEPGRGFVLHSSDYFSGENSMPVDERIALTATLDILRDMTRGEGPRRAFVALGYAGWGPGQLDDEILGNGWLHCDSDADLIFGDGNELKYAAALGKIGVDPLMLSAEAGHC
jgi:putative transcriptional regulator